MRAGWMRPSCDQLLERQLRDLASHRVEGGQHHRRGRLVDDEVDARDVLERADVAPLAADDPPLHVVARAARPGTRWSPTRGRRRDAACTPRGCCARAGPASRRVSSSTWRTTRAFSWRASSSTSRRSVCARLRASEAGSALELAGRPSPPLRIARCSRCSSSRTRSASARSRPSRSAMRGLERLLALEDALLQPQNLVAARAQDLIRSPSTAAPAGPFDRVRASRWRVDIGSVGRPLACQRQCRPPACALSRAQPTPPPRRRRRLRSRSKLPCPSLLDQEHDRVRQRIAKSRAVSPGFARPEAPSVSRLPACVRAGRAVRPVERSGPN